PPPAPPLFPYTTLFRSRRLLVSGTASLAASSGRTRLAEHRKEIRLMQGAGKPSVYIAHFHSRGWRLRHFLVTAVALSLLPGCHRSEEHTSELQSRENLV